MNIFEKLAYIQQHLRALKDMRNDFGGYNYRSAESILEAAKPHLATVGAAIVIADDIVQIGDRFYIKATATLIDTEGGQSHSANAFAREAIDKKGMDVAQITGSASSYARKYALSGLFAIDNCDDPDATNTHGNPAPICEKCGRPVVALPGAPIPTILGQAEKFYRRPACVCADCLRADVARLNAAKAARRREEEAAKTAEEVAKADMQAGMIQCDGCGEFFNPSVIHETEHGHFCPDCFTKEVDR